MTQDYREDLHQASGQQQGQGFRLLEESPNWTDDDVLYEISIWGETVGYARVTRDFSHSMHQPGLRSRGYFSEDDLSSNLEEGAQDGALFGDLYLERRNDLDEAPIINNGDSEVAQTGESYQIIADGEYVGEAVMAGQGLQNELWAAEDDYTGHINVEEATSSAPGRLEF